jgi:hypothetical protein
MKPSLQEGPSGRPALAHRRLVLTDLHQFSVFAASRGEGLHPELRALLERAAVSPFSEVSIRHDGLIQAGPSPDSEVISSRVAVALFPREPVRPVVAASKPEMRKLSVASPKRDRVG